MILTFVKEGKVINMFSAHNPPDIGRKVRLTVDGKPQIFTVADIIYEYYGRNDDHKVEVQVI